MYLLETIDVKIFFLLLFIIFIIFLILSYRNNIASFLKINDIPNYRKIHINPTPLIGGICFFVGITILLFFNYLESIISKEKLIFHIIFFTIFFLTGLFDDIKSLSPRLRSILIIVSITILIFINNDFEINELRFKSIDRIIFLNNFSILFTLFSIFALYNALNFIDGVNGSATSIIIFWGLFLFLKSPSIIYFGAILIMIMIFIYNIQGKIFLGNSGTSLFSIFFSLSIIENYNNDFIFADEILIILLFPGIDMIRVTIERMFKKKKIYSPDKTHFHHHLINAKFNKIWQIIILLTVLPLILFYVINNMLITIIISVLTYFIILNILKKYVHNI